MGKTFFLRTQSRGESRNVGIWICFFHEIYTVLSLKFIFCNLIQESHPSACHHFPCTFQVLGCVRKKSSLTTKPVTVRFIRLGYPAIKRGWIFFNVLHCNFCRTRKMMRQFSMKVRVRLTYECKHDFFQVLKFPRDDWSKYVNPTWTTGQPNTLSKSQNLQGLHHRLLLGLWWSLWSSDAWPAKKVEKRRSLWSWRKKKKNNNNHHNNKKKKRGKEFALLDRITIEERFREMILPTYWQLRSAKKYQQNTIWIHFTIS